MTATCIQCTKEFKTYPIRIKTGRGKFCSRICHGQSKLGKPSLRKTGKDIQCLTCGNKFYAPMWLVKKNGAKYCKYECYWKSKENKKPWNYEGKTTLAESIRKSAKYKRWRKAVFERDNYTCQVCNKRGNGTLNADHIKPFALYEELRFDLSNGRTLCIDCHRQTDTYGRLGVRTI